MVKLLESVRACSRLRHVSPRTEEAYVYWITQFVKFHSLRHPCTLAEKDIRIFLTHLAVQMHVSASTQNQALNALVFLFKHVLHIRLGDFGSIPRAQSSRRIPSVFSGEEAAAVIRQTTGVYRLILTLLYGSGLRLQEALCLRVNDIDLANNRLIVRSGKGEKDRVTLLPVSAVPLLNVQLKMVKVVHLQDCAEGFGEASMPYALERKYPNAARKWEWQYLFPASQRTVVRETGRTLRHHLHETAVQRVAKDAIQKAQIPKHASCHTFRHSFATYLLESGCDIRTVQSLLGHKDVRTTMIYTHLAESHFRGIRSPADYVPAIPEHAPPPQSQRFQSGGAWCQAARIRIPDSQLQ
jgi:integron integrase